MVGSGVAKQAAKAKYKGAVCPEGEAQQHGFNTFNDSKNTVECEIDGAVGWCEALVFGVQINPCLTNWVRSESMTELLSVTSEVFLETGALQQPELYLRSGNHIGNNSSFDMSGWRGLFVTRVVCWCFAVSRVLKWTKSLSLVLAKFISSDAGMLCVVPVPCAIGCVFIPP